jgi:hypothetical protein
MDEVRVSGIVDDVDRNGFALLQAQRRSRHRFIIGRGLDDLARRDLQGNGRDPDRVISRRNRLRANGAAGKSGALAAWTAFTLPSAIMLVVFAYGLSALGRGIG